MALCLLCCLTVIYLLRETVSFKRTLATILLLKSKLSGKCQRFNAIDESIEMLKNS